MNWERVDEIGGVLKTRAQNLRGENEENREILSENNWCSDGYSKRLSFKVKWFFFV
jgi:hypothetical protein